MKKCALEGLYQADRVPDVTDVYLYSAVFSTGLAPLPIPGLQAGDEAHFKCDYFANSRELSLPSERLSGLLAVDENACISPRKTRK